VADILQYLRSDALPHIWCPGCGHGIVLGAILRAVARLDPPKDEVVVVSGIGCAARAPGCLDFNTLHTTHGRALAFATGIKLARPDLRVIVITGDGDAAAIGGNHLIHAARRNVGLTTVCFNNSIYGMTGGQYSPLTPLGAFATTAPHGHLEPAFDLCNLAKAAGASFVARGTAYHAAQLTQLVYQALLNDGFSFVEAVSQCPVSYGRRNRMGGPMRMLEWQKEHSVNVKLAERMSPEELEGKFLTGVLHSAPRPEYARSYSELIARLGAAGNGGTGKEPGPAGAGKEGNARGES
jgi:2-oxoglutarate ferredoxin oxidoreductase subunit beta